MEKDAVSAGVSQVGGLFSIAEIFAFLYFVNHQFSRAFDRF